MGPDIAPPDVQPTATPTPAQIQQVASYLRYLVWVRTYADPPTDAQILATMARFDLPPECLDAARTLITNEDTALQMDMTTMGTPEQNTAIELAAREVARAVRAGQDVTGEALADIVRSALGLQRLRAARVHEVLQAGVNLGLFAADMGDTVATCSAYAPYDTPSEAPQQTPPTPDPPQAPPTPDATPASPGLMLLVNCVVLRGANCVHWSHQWADVVRATLDDGNLRSLGEADYNQGYREVAARIAASVRGGEVISHAIMVDTNMVGDREIFAALAPLAWCIVRGTT